MPSVAEEPPAVSPSRKRRRDDDRDRAGLQQMAAGLFEKLSGGGYPSDAAAATFFVAGPPFAVLADEANNRNRDGLELDSTAGQDGFAPQVVLPRKILPLPAAKRMRLADGGPGQEHHQEQQQQQHHQHQQDPRSRPRHSRSPEPRGILQDQTNAANRTQPAPPTRTTSSLLLNPCHICHRRPTKKSDLDSFANCQGCGQRTCFVCIRECLGWLPARHEEDGGDRRRDGGGGGDIDDEEDVLLQEQEALSRSFHMDDVRDDGQHDSSGGAGGRGGSQMRDEVQRGWQMGGHRQMVCSRCCIEKGSEGDVVCLGCLSRTEAV